MKAPAPPDEMPLGELFVLLVSEGKRRIVSLTVLFAAVATGVLAAGLLMPKRWEASTLIVSDPRSIIKPLLEGRAVPTTIADQMPVVTPTMASRRVLREIVTFGGWAKGPLSPFQEDRLLKQAKDRIKIETSEETVKITYFDTDPQRAYRITNKLGEIFIREASQLKEKQSREAFEFIAGQVKEYAAKLEQAQEDLLAHYRGKDAAEADTTGGKATAQTSDHETGARRSRKTPEELAALRVEEATLGAQLGGKPTKNLVEESRQVEEQQRARVGQLQVELDRLHATYTDQHPDVIRVQHELSAAQDDLAQAKKLRADPDKAVAAAATIDDDVRRAAAERLAVVQQELGAAAGTRRRPFDGEPVASAAPTMADLEVRNVGEDTVLSELVRRYEATRDVYQDLLKRRENARVSMDLDAEHRGLALRVQVAAELPVVSSSIRLLHVALGGLALAVALPLALLFAFIKVDPRIRSPKQIERMTRLPLLVAIPRTITPQDIKQVRVRAFLAATIVVVVFAIYAAALVVKMRAS